MTDEEQQSADAAPEEAPPSEAGQAVEPGPRPVGPVDEELDVYPIRPPEQDPRWAVWIMWIWIGLAVFALVFILVLIVLGFFYG